MTYSTLESLQAQLPAPLATLPPLVLVLVPVCLGLLVLLGPLRRYCTARTIPGIPHYPDGSLFLGDMKRVGSAMTKSRGFSSFFDQVAQDLGPIAQIRVGPLATFVVLTDLPEIESVLHRPQFDRATNTIDMFHNVLPTGQIALRTGHMWKRHRRIIGAAMTSKYLSLTAPRANEAIQSLIALMKEKRRAAGPGKSWAAENDMESATMDAICGMAFGSSWGIIDAFTRQVAEINDGAAPTGLLGEATFVTEKPALAQSVWYIFETVPTMSSFPNVVHFFRRLRPTYRKHHKQLRSYLTAKRDAASAKAKEMGADAAVEAADNTLDLMIARELRGDDWLPDGELEDEIYQYLLAGTETSGVALSWWLKYMTNNPDIQRKLRDHLLDALPELADRAPTFEDLNATTVPFLEAVVHEVLRLSRTAGGYSRDVIEDTMVLGHMVPKGVTMIMPTATSWEDASSPLYNTNAVPGSKGEKAGQADIDVEKSDRAVRAAERLQSKRSEGAQRKVGFWAAGTGKKFMPERWLDDEGRFDISRGPSLPFSLGQRACFGKNLALMELRLFITQLNLAFFFASVPENQNSFGNHETVANHPDQCFIRPIDWSSPEAQQLSL